MTEQEAVVLADEIRRDVGMRVDEVTTTPGGDWVVRTTLLCDGRRFNFYSRSEWVAVNQAWAQFGREDWL